MSRESTHNRFMRRMATIVSAATLAPAAEPRVTLGASHKLTLDGHAAYVCFGDGWVALQMTNGWRQYRLPQGREWSAVREIHREITQREKLVAERAAAAEEYKSREEARIAAERERVATIRAGMKELQARFNDVLTQRGAPTQGALRFYVVGSEGGFTPTYMPTSAAVIVSMTVSLERAAALTDLLIAGGFILGNRSTK